MGVPRQTRNYIRGSTITKRLKSTDLDRWLPRGDFFCYSLEVHLGNFNPTEALCQKSLNTKVWSSSTYSYLIRKR